METQLYNNGTAIYPVTDPESKPLIVTLTGLDNSWTGGGYAFTTNKTTEEIEAASDINVIMPVAIASTMGFTVNNDIILFPYDKGNKQFIVFAGRTKLYGHFYENSLIVERQSLLTFDDIESSIAYDYQVSPDLAASTELVKRLYEDVIDSQPFIVNVTTDWSNTTTSTTTWEDLYAAYTAGKLIYIIHTDTIETRTYSNVVKMQWAEELKFYTLESGILYILTWNAQGITPTNSSLSSLLTLDSTPTINSSNPVTSNGIYTALQGKANVVQVIQVESDPMVIIDIRKNNVYDQNKEAIDDIIDDTLTEPFTNEQFKYAMSQNGTYTIRLNKSEALLIESLNQIYGTDFFSLTWVDDGSFSLQPNTFYDYGTITEISITLGSGETGILNVYTFGFTAGIDNPSVTLPSTVKIAGDKELKLYEGDYCEFTIANNVASFVVA